MKSLLSGTIKNEYERIATNVAGDDIHKWDSFVYMVCTILRGSNLSTDEKLDKASTLLHIKMQPPIPPPEIPNIVKYVEIGSSLDALRTKYIDYSNNYDRNHRTFRYSLKIAVPPPLSHSVDMVALSSLNGNNTVVATNLGIQHDKCYREADGLVFESASNDSSEYSAYQLGLMELMKTNFGPYVKENTIADDNKNSDFNSLAWGIYVPPSLPVVPLDNRSVPLRTYATVKRYWFKAKNIEGQLITGFPCLEITSFEKILS